MPNSGAAITINAEANDFINLIRLTLDGIKIANTGILFISDRSLTVTHFAVRSFNFGIFLVPTQSSAFFLIGDTLVSDNSANGVSSLWQMVVPQAPSIMSP